MRRSGSISRKKWTEIFEGQVESGLSQAEYCREQGVNLSAFYSELRRRRIRGELLPVSLVRSVSPKVAKSKVPSAFIPVEVATATPALKNESEIVVELLMGVVTRFRGMATR